MNLRFHLHCSSWMQQASASFALKMKTCVTLSTPSRPFYHLYASSMLNVAATFVATPSKLLPHFRLPHFAPWMQQAFAALHLLFASYMQILETLTLFSPIFGIAMQTCASCVQKTIKVKTCCVPLQNPQQPLVALYSGVNSLLNSLDPCILQFVGRIGDHFSIRRDGQNGSNIEPLSSLEEPTDGFQTNKTHQSHIEEAQRLMLWNGVK